MIIGIDISQIVYNTGVSRYTRELVRHLLKLDKHNHYKLFAGVWRQRQEIDGYFKQLTKEGLEFEPIIKIFPPKVAQVLWNQYRMFPVETFTGKVDVWHASNWTFPRTNGLKVVTVHDLTPVLYPQHHTTAMITAFTQHLHHVTQEADVIIADSQATKNDLCRLYSFDSRKIQVIYLAAGEAFKPEKKPHVQEQVLNKYGIRKSFILSVATKEPRKNLKRVIAAFNKLSNKEIQLVLVGKAGWGEQIHQHSDRIIETGFVSEADLPILYSSALGFVYVSEYEGFGLPVLEAMSCGCPVITSNRSSLWEVAADAAITVDPADIDSISKAINRIISDSDCREQLRVNGLKQARKFSWDKTAQETLALYQSLKAFALTNTK